MKLTGQWTPDERLYVIAWIAAGIRYRNMNNIPHGESPNSETIMGLATSSSDSLRSQVQIDAVNEMILDLVSQGVEPKTIEQCAQEFEQMKAKALGL